MDIAGLLHADDMVLCGESEEYRKVMVRRFIKVCRKGLKFNADKRNLKMLGWMEALGYDICVEGARLEQVSEFKYLEYVLDE